MIHVIVNTFFLLIASHFFGDYVFQGDPMAQGKNHKKNTNGYVPWYIWLSAHASVHGTLVGFVLGGWQWGLVEYVMHWLIDYSKCDGAISFHRDQQLHLACKFLYFFIWVLLQVAP